MSEQALLGSLFRLAHSLKKQTHQYIEEMDLSIAPMHVRVMKIIQHRAPCTANDVVQYLSRDKAQVTRLLKTLLEEDLIKRIPNPNDKRSQLLSVTSMGEAIMEQIEDSDRITFATMTRNLSEQEIAEFQRVATIMAQNLTKQ
ncbi:MarR family winged helix-turn-helix transcriptional regulator [Ferrimonas pelagia]|uniref:MarR family transcriptional regulator n=1 Tax=Ferrimonas pelagia TaxID=1177826 RepID=A0ABP9EMM4_9GAMM